MIFAPASDISGTGKTTVAASLAISLAAEQFSPPLFLDCDREASNACLFLHPRLAEKQDAGLLIPALEKAKCTFCRKCAQVCSYRAIAALGKKALVDIHPEYGDFFRGVFSQIGGFQ
jgi:MinD superfamily P-loop ATPase